MSFPQISMATLPQQSGNNPPPKPWERAGGSSGPAPFKPPSGGCTSDVVEASGTANPGEIVSSSGKTAVINTNAVGRPLPPRPWEPNYRNSTYGGSGSGMYGLYGGVGGLNTGGMYGNSLYGRGNGMYGGGMYNGGLGGQMDAYGMGMGGPYGNQDPNNPSPPGFWISLLRVMHGVVDFFGRISILIDQNTQAVHMFMSALLMIFDRSGMLYGELARFVFRLLGIRKQSSKVQPLGPAGMPLPGPQNSQVNPSYNEQPKALPTNSWDNVWGNDANK